VLPGVEELTTTELRDVTGQAVIIVDPDGAEDRHQDAAARRELRMQPGPDGMATLKAHLPADGAVKIFQVSDLLAAGTAGTPGDRRGIGARRVDALVDIADHLLTHGFVDLTDYLGEQLPDHGTPTPRARRTSTSTSTSTSASTETATTAPTGSADVSSNEAAADTSDDNADTDINDKTTTDTDTEVPAATTPATSTPATTAGANTASADAATPPTEDGEDTDVMDAEATTETAQSAPNTDTDVPADINTDDPANTDTDGPEAASTPEATAPESLNDTRADADADVSSGARDAAAATGAAAKGPSTKRGGNRAFTRQGRRPHLSVTIGLSTLAGLDNLPGVLAGFGAIPAGLARSIAASAATINALITDPDTGTITAAGALKYRPTQELRDQIAAILNVCQFPSCRQPVWRCDMDHREEFNHQHPEQGGKTDETNVGPMCRRHHLIKHHSDWRIRIDPNRYVLEFTSPTGHTYQKQSRQAAVPALWVSTGATAIAERLDNITSPPTTLVRHPGDQPAPTSHIEDLLAAILVRHNLNTKTIDIDYNPETTWETADLDDPPPF
jgi:hypothetical protein